jgi:hypothetical protein
LDADTEPRATPNRPDRVFRLTFDSNSVSGDTWALGFDAIVALADECSAIEIARTTGTIREPGRGHDADAAARRLALLHQLPAAVEAFRLDTSSLDSEATLAGSDEPAGLVDAISQVLWGRELSGVSDRSDHEDVIHLATHARAGRDVFVTTDERILGRKEELRVLGVAVADPGSALLMAEQMCAPDVGG